MKPGSLPPVQGGKAEPLEASGGIALGPGSAAEGSWVGKKSYNGCAPNAAVSVSEQRRPKAIDGLNAADGTSPARSDRCETESSGSALV